jgi:Putative Flp pilus-assembly TadE/G-like
MSLRPTDALRPLRRRVAQEQGAAAVVVAVCLVVFLGFAALAINIGSLYQAQRQAQSAADAGALAAADDLGTSTASSATSDGTTYATTNYPGSNPTVNVNAAGSQVTVNVTASTPTFLGGLFGSSSFPVSAKAVAGRGPGVPCVTPGNTCYAIFASDPTCGTGHGITMSGSGNTITGAVHSDGSLNLSGGNQSLGPTTIASPLSSCLNGNLSSDTYNGAAQPLTVAPIVTWPDDYSQVFTACGGSGQVACSGPGGTPSYCTQAAASFTFANGGTTPVSGNVYCAYGTGSVTTPSTWNGVITFGSGSLGSAATPIQGTWIGGTIDIEHKSFLSTQTTTPTYPLFYALGSGNCSPASSGGVCMSAGSDQLNGTIFAPNGTINFSGAGSTANFLEAKDVNFQGGNFTGNGPTAPSGATSGGGVSLLQ